MLQIAFAATDAVAGLKMIDNGMPKERLALLGVPMIPIQIVLPLIISKYTGGSEPLNVFMKAYPFRFVVASSLIYSDSDNKLFISFLLLLF